MRYAEAKQSRVGTTTFVMCTGHVVVAEITDIVETFPGTTAGDPRRESYVCRFIMHAKTGATRVCRDAGSEWFIEQGETFEAEEIHVARAEERVSEWEDAAEAKWEAAHSMR